MSIVRGFLVILLTLFPLAATAVVIDFELVGLIDEDQFGDPIPDGQAVFISFSLDSDTPLSPVFIDYPGAITNMDIFPEPGGPVTDSFFPDFPGTAFFEMESGVDVFSIDFFRDIQSGNAQLSLFAASGVTFSDLTTLASLLVTSINDPNSSPDSLFDFGIEGFNAYQDDSMGINFRIIQLDATISQVPLPAAAWLFLTGLCGIFGAKHRWGHAILAR
jgi:hypothetical protein